MGLFQLTMYGVGLILGAGIYVLIGEAAGFAGDAVWIAFALGSVVALFAGFSYAELSSIFPKAAAEYVFVKNAFRNDFIAFLIGWLTVITSIITATTVALGFGGYLAEFVNVPIILSAIILLIVLSMVNFVGIRESAWTNTIFTIIEASGLILIIMIGFAFGGSEPVNYAESPTGFTGIAIAFVLVFFAFIGFEGIANIAEEVKKPRKTLPRAIVLSVVVSAVLYVLVSLAVVRVVSWEDLAASSAPIALVAQRGLGPETHVLLSVIALFAITNTVLITLVAGSRIFYGMAKQNVFPSILEKIHYRTKTPWLAVVVILIMSAAFTLIGDIVTVANIAVFAIVITFAAVNLAVIVLRYTEPDMERKFKVPINVGRFPILSLFGMGISIYMGFQFEVEVVMVGILIIAIGAVFYLMYKIIKPRYDVL